MEIMLFNFIVVIDTALMLKSKYEARASGSGKYKQGETASMGLFINKSNNLLTVASNSSGTQEQ